MSGGRVSLKSDVLFGLNETKERCDFGVIPAVVMGRRAFRLGRAWGFD